jgi:hypothetical protein
LQWPDVRIHLLYVIAALEGGGYYCVR